MVQACIYAAFREPEQDYMRRKREIYKEQTKKRYTTDKHLHSTTGMSFIFINYY